MANDSIARAIAIAALSGGQPGPGGTSDFDELSNRPKYNGANMTHGTDIPQVKTAVWDAKQDAISDLSTIRSGAEAGATALQPAALADYSTTTQMNAAIAAHHDSTKQDALTAGSNITIAEGVISATDTTYSAGTGISITDGVIANTQTPGTVVSGTASGDNWSTITIAGTTKNIPVGGGAAYTAGNGIDITDNEISVDTDVVATQTDLAAKQDTISDLSTIRSGAGLGATAVQPAALESYRTSADQDTIDNLQNSIIAGKSVVSGTSNAGNWTSITIDGTTNAIPAGASGSTDFDQLTNRPKYNGATITSATDIPEVKTSAWDAKQEAISDLSTIRSGAALGATALQAVPATYRTAADQNIIDAAQDASIAAKSTVSGTNDGTNWTAITIDGVSKNIPQGGSGGTSDFDQLNNRPSYNGIAMTHTTAIPEVKTATWDAKQDAISDLSTIRSGASAGATAVQPAAISDMATKTWVGEQGYLTSHQSLAAYRTSADQDTIDTNLTNAINAKSVVSGTNDGTNWSTITINGTTKAIPSGGSGTTDFDVLSNRPSYNGVAMSHLTDIPEVKTAVWDAKSTVTGTNDGTYWQSITIDGTTKYIPQGGGGGGSYTAGEHISISNNVISAVYQIEFLGEAD